MGYDLNLCEFGGGSIANMVAAVLKKKDLELGKVKDNAVPVIGWFVAKTIHLGADVQWSIAGLATRI